MVNIGCFFPTCKLAYDQLKRNGKFEELRNMKLFKPPEDGEKFELWKQAIPKGRKELTRDDLLCELHFKSDDFIRFELDGSTPKQRQWKRITRLRDDAVPSIFYLLKTDLPPDILSIVPKISTFSKNLSMSSNTRMSSIPKVLNASSTRELQSFKKRFRDDSKINLLNKSCSSCNISVFKSTDAVNSINCEPECFLPKLHKETETEVISPVPEDYKTANLSDERSLSFDAEVDKSDEVSDIRSPCLVTYSKKSSKYSKINRNSIQVISYPPSLYKDINQPISGTTLDDTSSLDSYTSGISDDVTKLKEPVDDVSVSHKKIDLNILTDVRTISSENSAVTSNNEITRKRPLSPKRTNNQTFTNLFFKKTKNQPDETSLSSTNLQKRKSQYSSRDIVTDRVDNSKSECDNITEMEPDVEIVPVFSDDESLNKFDFLVTQVRSVQLLPYWSYTLLESKMIIFIRWNDVFNNIIKQVTVSAELEIKVYVHRVRVEIDKYGIVEDLERLEKLLKIVDGINPCEGFGDGIRRSEKCRGFVSSNRGRPTVKVCIHCKLEKSKLEKEKERRALQRNQLSEIRVQCKELMKENSLLCKHVESCCGIQLKSYIVESTELGLEDIGEQ